MTRQRPTAMQSGDKQTLPSRPNLLVIRKPSAGCDLCQLADKTSQLSHGNDDGSDDSNDDGSDDSNRDDG